MYHLRLIKGLSYAGVVAASRKNPDVFTKDQTIAEAALASGYFELLEKTEPDAQTLGVDENRLAEMKLEDLKQLAADLGVESQGMRTKAELAKAISAVQAAPDGEGV